MKKKINIWCCAVDSNHSQRVDIGSADVDWSNWGDDWPTPGSRDHADDQSEWTEWSSEPPATNRGPASSKSSGSRYPTKPTEQNLIDFDVGEENRHNNGADSEAVGDGWDADVWADVDDDNWEPLETLPAKSS